MPKKPTWKAGQPYAFTLNLPPEIAIDLHAFCELHYKGSMTEIARRAIQRLIQQETANKETRREFEEIRRRIASEPIRLVSETDTPMAKAGER